MSKGTKAKKTAHDRGEEARRLGIIAEREVSYRCTQAGFTVNKSDEDTEGWDFFLQLPTSSKKRRLLDVIPPQLSCLVQVKATASPDGSTKMTLANALRLAKSTIPTFVLVAHVSDDSVARWWLLHCGEKFIEKTLSKLVRFEQSQQETLNKVWIKISSAEGEDLPIRGAEVRSAIERHIGKDTYEYVHQKRRWLSRVGYGKAAKSFDVAVSSKMTDGLFLHMARFAVGLEKSLPVESINIYDLRFGLRRHEKSYVDVSLELPKIPAGPAVRVEVRGRGEDPIVFDGHTYAASSILPFIPSEHDIVRIKTRYIDMYVGRDPGDPDLMRAHWTLRGMGRQFSEKRIGRLSNAARAMRLLLSGAAELTLWSGDVPYAIPIGSPAASDPELTDDLQDIEEFGIIARVFGIQLGNDPVSKKLLTKQRQQLRLLALVATGNNAQGAVRFSPGAAPDGFDPGQRCAIMFAPWLRTTQSLLVVITAMVGVVAEVADEPGVRQIESSRLMPLSKSLVSAGTKVDVSTMYAEAEAVLSDMGVTGVYRPAPKEENS